MEQLTFFGHRPTYGRAAQLLLCLRTLARLDYPPGRSRSSWWTRERSPGDPPPPTGTATFRLSLLRVRMLGLGLRQHCRRPCERSVSRLRRRRLRLRPQLAAKPRGALQLQPPNHAIGGQTLNALPDNLYSMASHLLHAYIYSYYNADPDAARFFASNNFAVPAAAFRAIGGFNTIFGTVPSEDREFCYRWRHRGYRMTYAPRSWSNHAAA